MNPTTRPAAARFARRFLQHQGSLFLVTRSVLLTLAIVGSNSVVAQNASNLDAPQGTANYPHGGMRAIPTAASPNAISPAAATIAPSAANSATGRITRALSFDGQGGRVETPKTAALQFSTGSIGVWFKASANVTEGRTIISDQPAAGTSYSYRLWLASGTGELKFDFTRGGGTAVVLNSGVNVNDNAWHHAVVLRDDSAKTIQLFLDGSLIATGTYTGVVDNNNTAIWVGQSQATPSNPFIGQIDELSIFNRLLTNAEIKKHLVHQDEALVLYHLDEASGATSFANSGDNAANSALCDGACPGIAGAASRFGNGLTFSGAESLSFTRPVQDDFTISFWFKSTQIAGANAQWYNGSGLVDGEVGGITNDFGVSLGGGQVLFGVGNPDVTIRTTASPANGSWHHVAATRLSSTGAITLYIDGAQVAVGTGGTQPLNVPGVLRIGKLQTLQNAGFVGQMDEVAVFNRALAPEEIAQLYTRSPLAVDRVTSLSVTAPTCNLKSRRETCWTSSRTLRISCLNPVNRTATR